MEEGKGNEHVKSTDPKYMELVSIAVNGYNDGTFKTITEAANHVNIHRTTVGRHIKNQIQLRDRAFEKQQYLRYFAENSFAEFLVRLNRRVGIPLSNQLVRSLAYCVKTNADHDAGKNREQLKPPGGHWVKRFEQRSGAKFGLSIESSVKDQRSDLAALKKEMAQWVQDRLPLLDNVPRENIAYIDQIDLDSVLNGLPQSGDPIFTDETPENLTVFETVFADGTIAPGFLVTSSPEQDESMASMIDGLKADGWGSTTIPQDVKPFELLRHFDQVSKPRYQAGTKRVLFIEGPFSLDEITRLYLETNSIELITLPEHTSHLLHLLNPSYFGPVNAYLYQEAVKKVSAIIGSDGVLRDVWLAMHFEKRREWTKQNIIDCFEKTGLFPLNGNKLANQLSYVTIDICERYSKDLIERTINLDCVNETIDEQYLSNRVLKLFASLDRFLNSRLVPVEDKRKIIESVSSVQVNINDPTGKATRYKLSEALESDGSSFHGSNRVAFLDLLGRGALPLKSSKFLECAEDVFENRGRAISENVDGNSTHAPLMEVWARLFESVMNPDFPVVRVQNDLVTLYRAYEAGSLREDLLRAGKRENDTVSSLQRNKRHRLTQTNR